MKFARQARGPIQAAAVLRLPATFLSSGDEVIFPEPADPVVVRPTAKLQDAARAAGFCGRIPPAHVLSAAVAGHNVVYQCDDGLCGSCWHVSESTGDIYQLRLGRESPFALYSSLAEHSFMKGYGPFCLQGASSPSLPPNCPARTMVKLTRLQNFCFCCKWTHQAQAGFSEQIGGVVQARCCRDASCREREREYIPLAQALSSNNQATQRWDMICHV